MEFNQFLALLAKKLRPHYAPPNVAGGHDFTHVERLINLGIIISVNLPSLKFSVFEYVTAAWLHNLDRSNSLKKEIEAAGGLGDYCRIQLAESSFDLEERERIVDAVLQHNKKDDEPNDSSLLTALRIADKIDRFGPLGIFAIAAHSGAKLLPYDPRNPFGYGSTAENKLKSVYNDCFRVLEWYGMLPSDEARSLVNLRRLRFYVQFLRMLGEEITEATGAENGVEDDIRKALGSHYHRVLGIETSPEILDER